MRVALTLAYLIAIGVTVWAVSSLNDPSPEPLIVMAESEETPPTINVVVMFPTETPFIPPTVVPERTITPTLNDCGTATPGALCEKPRPTLPAPTPYPSCEQLPTMRPDDICIWPTVTP